MEILRTAAEVAAWRRKMQPKRLGFIPTMGALHDGHLSLVEAAQKAGMETTVVSIFVNPTQFGPHEDFHKYPRPVERDIDLLTGVGADALFLPTVETIYPPEDGKIKWETRIPGLTDRLEGAVRPGHFSGVIQVVAKLFHLLQPDAAFFGQKDLQQCAVIRTMVRQLFFPLEIVVVPTSRESDGLARSSRNVYLSAEDRRRAPILFRALSRMREMCLGGENRVEVLLAAGLAEIGAEPAFQTDYLEIVSARDFSSLTGKVEPKDEPFAVVASRLGTTRLLDNLPLF